MKQRNGITGILIFSILSAGLLTGAELKNDCCLRTYTIRPGTLPAIRIMLQAEGPEWLTETAQFVQAEAEEQYPLGPWSVLDKPDHQVAPTGDRQDFVSGSPYHWPREDGQGYEWRDGQINPDQVSSDNTNLYALYYAAPRLITAGYILGEDRYLKRAAMLIRTWFVDPETRMNPHTRFAAGIPGVVDGRASGLHRIKRLPEIIDFAGILAATGHWSNEDDTALKDWVRDYSKWALTSDIGIEEKYASNNHAVYYGYPILAGALYTGDKALAKHMVEEYFRDHLLKQIEADGFLPAEYKRTKAFHYTIYTIVGYARFAWVAQQAGYEDIFDWKTEGGGSIRDSMLHIIPYLKGEKEWPVSEVAKPLTLHQSIEFLRISSLITGDPFFENYLREHYPKWAGDYLNIWFPPAARTHP